MDNLRNTFKAALQHEGLTLTDFCGNTGLMVPSLSNWEKGRVKTLSIETQKSFFKGFKKPETRIALFEAHCQDLIENAGLDDSVESITINLK